nr:purine-nucleoside phosphorylase [Pseudobdellovibrionaceae bacterium]
IRALSLLGVESLLLTNSAGGMGDTMSAGDFMIIEDHINMMGSNPLIGPNIKEFGPRFPDMTEAYDKKLNTIMAEIFEKHNIRFHRGIYCGVTGPTYETPAEIRFMKMIGAQAVGMSTVPETIAANHMGLRVGAISCITNLAAGLSNKRLSHDEVTETASRVQKGFNLFLTDLLKAL